MTDVRGRALQNSEKPGIQQERLPTRCWIAYMVIMEKKSTFFVVASLCERSFGWRPCVDAGSQRLPLGPFCSCSLLRFISHGLSLDYWYYDSGFWLLDYWHYSRQPCSPMSLTNTQGPASSIRFSVSRLVTRSNSCCLSSPTGMTNRPPMTN